jgi:5-methylcytosine-specific restriction endonuclease McrA
VVALGAVMLDAVRISGRSPYHHLLRAGPAAEAQDVSETRGESDLAKSSRKSIPIPVQVEVLYRDQWLCTMCRRPVVFPLAMKLLEESTARALPGVVLAYWNPQWRRDAAPLLDELAACIDHVVAYSKSGEHTAVNFATACARCNQRKSARDRDAFLAEMQPWEVKGKHGEPTSWDGFAAVFISLARQLPRELTATERAWLKAFESRADVGQAR